MVELDDLGEPDPKSLHPQVGDVDQRLSGTRHLPEPIEPLCCHVVDLLMGRRQGQPTICLETKLLFFDIVLW